MSGEGLEELAARAARADPVAFGLLYDRLYDSVYGYVRSRVADDFVAEDLCEQVFMAALGSIGQYRRRGGGVRAWLFRIARNDVLDHFRAARAVAILPLDAASNLPAGKGPEEEALEREEARRLRAAVGTLPEDQRDVVLLKFAAGLTNHEVAQVLRKSEAAVKSLQHRALVALGDRMRDEDVESPTRTG